MKFRKLALAAAFGSTALTATMPANAIVVGAAGEAYLVPFVIYDSYYYYNTLLQVTVPGAIGYETIPKDFTAINSTPTFPSSTDPDNAGPYLTGDVPDADTSKQWSKDYIHWFFLDYESKHVCNGQFPVTPDDFTTINWGDVVEYDGCNDANGYSVDGLPGYLVLTNQNTWSSGGAAAAKFPFFVDAYLAYGGGYYGGVMEDDDVASTSDGGYYYGYAAKLPALPMPDGVDQTNAAGEKVVTPMDGVVYPTRNQPVVSPLIAGMRTGRSDGMMNDTTYFDLTLSNRMYPTLHVVWLDQNGVFYESDIFDADENTCSGPSGTLKELNVWWIEPLYEYYDYAYYAPYWVNERSVCDPDGANDIGIQQAAYEPGFIRYGLSEYIDNDLDRPESAGVAFSIIMDEYIGYSYPYYIPMELAFGHERGIFK